MNEVLDSIISIKAYHLKRSIDIRLVRRVFEEKPLVESSSELLYGLEGKYCYIFNYGAIVFYNQEEALVEKTLQTITQLHALTMDDLLTDSFELVEDHGSYIEVEFSRLVVNRVDIDAIKIILLNMAQSIALNYYDSVAQDLIAEVRMFTTKMETTGKLAIHQKDILKFIGKALNTQNRIAENLYIFDSPAITWENEYYGAIHARLSRHFELNGRYRSIENTLKIIEANLNAFLDVNNHRESSRLEWIIIILILVEVIETFVTKFN
ncbi:MAG: RMD1 family protein [Fulvivirga sp.]|nr:RMD1 family protein [Fulvivirga sp.]